MFHGSRLTLFLGGFYHPSYTSPNLYHTGETEFNSDAVSFGATSIFGIYLHLQIRSRTLRAPPSRDVFDFQIHVLIKQDSADAVMRQKKMTIAMSLSEWR